MCATTVERRLMGILRVVRRRATHVSWGGTLVLWSRSRGWAGAGGGDRAGRWVVGRVIMIYHIERGHLRWSGKAIRISVKIAAGVCRVPEEPHTRQSCTGGRESIARTDSTLFFFVQGVTATSQIWQWALVRANAGKEEAWVDTLTNSLQLLLPTRTVLVVGVVLHMLHPQPLSLLHIRPFLQRSQGFPWLTYHKPDKSTNIRHIVISLT